MMDNQEKCWIAKMMDEKRVYGLVERHWEYLESVARKFFIDGFVHGFKHGLEEDGILEKEKLIDSLEKKMTYLEKQQKRRS